MNDVNELRCRYRELNSSFSKQLVFKLGISGGFFSEYNNMLVSMLYCLRHRIQFKLCSNEANFSISQGWCDYFEPFCEETIDGKEHYKTVDWRYLIKCTVKGKRIPIWHNILPYLHSFNNILLTQDVFGKARSSVNQNSFYKIPELNIYDNFRGACATLLNLTWIYNVETKREISDIIKELNLPSEYIGFHIRGGDKAFEYHILPVENYFEKVTNNTIKNAFVLTDDYRIFEDCVKKYPDWNFWTLCQATEKGYNNQNFVKESSTIKREKLLRLFAAMEILTFSVQFIGTYTANPGLFLGMRIPEKTACIDNDTWKLW